MKRGAKMTSQNCLTSASANSLSTVRLTVDDAAERRQRVARERALVGLERRACRRAAARVVVLDDRAGRELELLHQQPRGVEVEHVVERQLVAAELPHLREHVHARADLLVVGGALVRVLAVGEVGDLLVGAHDHRREVVEPLGEPARDRRVVAGGAGERLGGEALARGEREVPARLVELLEDRVVGLSGSTTTAENTKFFAAARIIVGPPMSMFSITSASVDPAAGRRLLERVEVHAHEVDELDLVLLRRDHVRRVVAAREQPGVELRVQRLDAPAHDLGEAGEVVDRADLEPGGLERLRRAPGGDDLDAEVGEPLRELDDPRLVRHGEHRAADPDLAWLRHRRRTLVTTRSARGVGWPGRSGPRRGRSAAPPRTAARARSGGARRGPRRPRSPPAGRPRAGG